MAKLVALAFVTAIFAGGTARADSFTPVGIGTLANGNIIETYRFTAAPGQCFPWHYHPGQMLVTILAGHATEDKGCGRPIINYKAGDAFAEQPGEMHHICVVGTQDFAATVTGVLPACFGNFADEVDLTAGPACRCGGSEPVFVRGPYLCTDGSGAYTPAATMAEPICSGEQERQCSVNNR